MNKILTFFIIAFVALVCTIIYKLRYLKSYFYYHPSKLPSLKPSSKIVDVKIPYDKNNNKLHAWYYLHNDNKDQPILLFCHGNAGNIGSRSKMLLDMIDNGISFLIFDYKGFK